MEVKHGNEAPPPLFLIEVIPQEITLDVAPVSTEGGALQTSGRRDPKQEAQQWERRRGGKVSAGVPPEGRAWGWSLSVHR